MLNNQLFIKTAYNRVIYDQETAWLKKNDSQTTICKLFFLFARAGIKPAPACITILMKK